MLASKIHGGRLAALALLLGAAALGACGGGDHFASSGSGGAAGTGGGAAGTGGGAAGTGGAAGSGGTVTDGGVDAPCADADGDGVTTCQGDCDDNDKNIHPGAPEICGDGKNNGCTPGQADQGCGGLGTFVSTKAGSPSGKGTMTDPVDSIARGLQNAQLIRQTNPTWKLGVYVAEGDYPEKVTLIEGISLYGGFSCTKASCTWKRDPKTLDSSIVDQNDQGVVASHNITRQTQLDGFHVQGESVNSTAATPGAAAVTIAGGSPTISNNTVDGPVISGNGSSIGIAISGIGNTSIQAPGPQIVGNTIRGGQAPSGASTGIVLGPPQNSSGGAPPATVAEITNNVIYGGNAKSSYGITANTSADGTVVGANIIGGGKGSGESWGIGFSSTLTIDANRINADPTQAASCPGSTTWCGGIQSWSGKAVITNNIVYGADATASAAVRLAQAEKQAQDVVVNSNFLVGAPPAGANAVPSAAADVVLANPGCSGCGTASVGRIDNNFMMPGRASTRFGVLEVQSPQDIHPAKLENNDLYFLLYAASSSNNVFYEGRTAGVPTDLKTLVAINALGFAAANFAADCYDTTFHQQSGSTCIDAGVSSDAPNHDFEGNKRPQGGGYDVGPDEAP